MATQVHTLSLESIQLCRAMASRASRLAAREIARDEAQALEQAQQEQHAADLRRIEAEISAQAAATDSFLGGAFLGALSGFAVNMGMLLLAPAGPACGGLGSALGGAPSATQWLINSPAATLGAVFGAAAGGGISAAIGQLEVARLNDQARAAGLEADEAALAASKAQSEVRAQDAEGSAEQKAIRRARAAMKDARQERAHAQAVLGAALRGLIAPGEVTLDGAGKALAAQAGLMASVGLEVLALAREEREAGAEAYLLERQAIAHRREAAEKRSKSEWLRAGLGLVTKAVEIASMILTAGGSAAATMAQSGLRVAGAGTGLVGALVTDEDARALERAAEALQQRAGALKDAAEDASLERQGADALRARLAEAARALAAEAKAGGGRAGSSAPLSFGAIQKLRALMALDEQKDARDDVRSAREARFSAEERAIGERTKGDEAETDKETQALVFAVVQAAFSVVSLLGSGAGADLSGTAVDSLKGLEEQGEALTQAMRRVAEVARQQAEIGKLLATTADKLGQFSQAADRAVALVVGHDRRKAEHQRQAERIGLEAQRARDRAKDAEDELAQARDDQRRALESAVQMQRDLQPSLA